MENNSFSKLWVSFNVIFYRAIVSEYVEFDNSGNLINTKE